MYVIDDMVDRMILEMGRFIVGPHGYFLTRVVNVISHPPPREYLLSRANTRLVEITEPPILSALERASQVTSL